MTDTIVDKIYNDFKGLLQYLEQNQQVSMINDADNNFKKVLLLSAASYFEHEITEILIKFVKIKSNDNKEIYSFIKIKGIDRKYYTYFSWEKKNANQFFALFGEEFKQEIINKINSESELEDSIKAFLEIGRLRNELVHENFASYPLDKTAEEIYGQYKQSLPFIELLSIKLS
jgi:hypothetical protein